MSPDTESCGGDRVKDQQAERIVVIGGGPAGYSAAIYAARAGLSPVCIEGYSPGGQILRSAGIHNYPGFPDGIPGAELGELMRRQAGDFGTRMVLNEVQSVDFGGPLSIVTDDREYLADAVIIATGAVSRALGIPSEEEYLGRGVAYCAICDGPFFAGRRVAVVGGGDAAAEEALALSQIASGVLLVHRRTAFRANSSIQAAVQQEKKITIVTPRVVAKILGDDEVGVTGLRTRHTGSGEEYDDLVDGVFIAIGAEPASAMFHRWLAVDESGFLRRQPDSRATSVPGVFVAGDVGDRRYRQIVTAAAAGAEAAIDAERWLSSRRNRPRPPVDRELTLTARPRD